MNRLKKELKKKGIKLECDYKWLPYYTKGDFGKPGNICVEGVSVVSNTATVYIFYNVIVEKLTMNRSSELVKQYE